LVLRGVLLNLVLAVMKFAGGIWGNTYALIADGVESLADVVSSLLVWTGFRWAAKPPDADHPYGHGKAESLAALGVAIFLFAATIWIAVHAVREIVTPHLVPAPWTLAVLAAVILLKTLFARRLRQTGGATGSTALAAESWHHAADALTSLAAFVGITIAVIGGPAYAAADDWAALVACGLIAYNGVRVTKQALGDIMDLAVPDSVEAEIRRAALAVPEVRGLDKCRVRRSGLSLLVEIHVEVDPELTVQRGHDIGGAVKHALLEAPFRITDVVVHIEPYKNDL
jgi:cation diffusion facilitator family transporter